MRKFYALALAMLATLCVSAQISVTVTGSANTTPALQTAYTSLASALNDLNAVTAMTGPVTMTLTAGTSETAPATGLTIGSASLNAVLSSTNTVTIVKAAGVATVLNAGVGTATPSSPAPDGILILAGADYVTINGLTFTDGNAANPATMEFGVGLFKLSATDGAQNNTIMNCIFNMQRVNNANPSSPMVDGSVGILVINSSPGAAITALTPTAASGTNSNNKFYTNTINGGNYGIALSGYAASSPFTLGDTGNDIGGTGAVSATTGNTILNYGGGGTSNPAAGIRANNQWNLNVSNNNINNNNGSGVNHGTTLRGIYGQAGTSGNVTISFNTITVNSAATTSALSAIENAIGSTASSNTVNINNNTIQNCSYTTATTGTFTAILNTATAAVVNINNNLVNNNTVGASGTASSGVFQGIYNSASSTNINLACNNNTISNNVVANSFGSMYGIRMATAQPLTANGNTVSNMSIPNSAGSTSSTMYGIFDGLSPVGETYNNNNINNLTITGSSTTTGHTIYGIYNNTGNNSPVVTSGNNINNLIFTSSGAGSSTVAGIRNAYGSTVNTFKNVIHTISSTGTTPTVAGIIIGSGSITTANVYNNLIGNLSTPGSTGANLHGLFMGTVGNNLNVYNNTVFINTTSTGTNFGSSAIYFSSTTPVVTIRNNILVNLSTATGTGLTAVIRRTSTSLTAYGSASNNNLLYAGTPSATNVLYYDGTNSYQTLSALRTAVAPRETASYTETVSATAGTYFQSLTGPATGTTTTFLHMVNGLNTYVESGGSGSGLGLTDDYDGNTRSATTPDIGADEFNGVATPNVDLAVTALVTPVSISCDNNSVGVTVRLTNTGNTAINFASTGVTLNAVVSGAVTANLSATINTGTLAAGASQNVVLTPNLSMVTSGSYNFAITLTMTGDSEPLNNTLNASSVLNPTVVLPQSVDFTGFTGSNLTTVFPNWYEAAGATTPSGTTSGWVNTTGTLGAGNVTAKINLYTNTQNEWIVGPKFTATANTKLKFDVALTDYNSASADPSAMQGTDDKVIVKISTDCGNTWSDLYTFNAANTVSISNSLVPQEINLATYAGQNVIIAFFASDGPTDDLPDYDFHIDNINVVNVLPTDVGATALALPSSIGCYGSNETVKVTIKNYGTSTLNFATNPVTVTTNVTGAGTATLTGTINTGSLAANATIDVTMTGTLNMSAGGTYTFNASTSMTGDAQTANDAMPATTRTTVAPVTLPQSVDFTGFTGTNLNAIFPNWFEATGATAPTGTTSTWVNTTGTLGATNVTAKINLYTNTKNDWIVGPKFAATTNSKLKFDVALTDYNSALADPSAMQGTDDKVIVRISTDCGTSWNDLYTFDASNTGSITNSLVPQEINLAAYAGQNVIIAFFASDGPVDDTPDYDFHIDNVNIVNVLPTDVGAIGLALPGTTACFGAAETVKVTIKNFGTNTLDFSLTPVTVTTNVTGAGTATLTGTLNSGTLAANSTVDVTMTGTLNMSAAGAYTFNASTSMTGDAQSTNDAMPAATRTVIAPVVLPQTVDFTGYTGADLNTLFPNWYEASGFPTPLGTTSSWVSATGLGTATNVTAKVNLYTTGKNEWIVGPKFTATALTQLTYKIAITDYNSTSADPAGMQSTDDVVAVKISTDCGNTWSNLQVYNAANTTAISNSLVSQSISLASYAGQNIIVAFYANEGTVDDAPDYDFHIDDVNILNVPLCTGAVGGTAVATTTTPFCGSGSTVINVTGYSTGTSSGYQWESSVDNTNWNSVAGQTNPATITTPTVTTTTYFRLKVTCPSGTATAYSNTITVTITSLPTVTITPAGPVTICAPATQLLTGSTNAATPTYQWKNNGTNISGATTGTYTVSGTGVYFLAVVDGVTGCTNTSGTVTVTVNPQPATVTVTPNSTAVCSGTTQQLSASGGAVALSGNATLGTATTLTSAAAQPTAFCNRWAQYWNQTIYTAAELTAAGLSAGSQINSISYTTTSQGDANNNTNFSISIGNTTNTTFTAFQTTGLSPVYGPATYTHAVGVNTITFTTPYTWNGTSNIVIDVRMDGVDNLNNAITYYTAAADNKNIEAHTSTTSATTPLQALVSGGTTTANASTTRLNIVLGWSSSQVTNITWAPVTGLYTDAAATVPYTAGTAATSVYAKPLTTATYTATSTSSSGCTNSGTATITVNAATAITTQPTSQTVCSGTNASFTVAATGGALTYQWRKGGTNITGATSATYTITGVVAADAANYDVVITGGCGNVTSNTVSLTVNAATAITTQPTAQTVCAGAAANFSVAATGTGTLTYQWRKGGTNITGATSASYSIAAVASGDAGNYDVVITGTCGSVTSTPVALIVNATTIITTQPTNQAACPGSNATFTVAAGGVSLTYQWRKGGTNITGANSATYTITNVTAANAGSFDVVITGACGNVTSTTVTLTVNTTTSITTQPTAQSACAGSTATMTVVAAGTGTLTYQWRKGGTNITGATSASYTINNVTATDAANYDVIVTGTCGNVTSAQVALTVNPKPTVDFSFTTACLGVANVFTNLSTVSSGSISTTVWDFGNGSTSTTSNPTFTYTLAGTYNVKLVATTNNGCKDSVTKALTISNCTGIPTVNSDVSSALMMPNLVEHTALLRVNATRTARINWTVVDMQGRTVMHFEQQVSSGQNDRTLYFSQLASGSYQLTGTTEKGKAVTIRFVKQ